MEEKTESRYLYGHLISSSPSPQQSHDTKPSGVAPKWGYSKCRHNPDFATVKFLCWSFITLTYAALAWSSLFQPQFKAGMEGLMEVYCMMYFTSDAGYVRSAHKATLPNIDAVMCPFRWSYQSMKLDCCLVDFSMKAVSSYVNWMSFSLHWTTSESLSSLRSEYSLSYNEVRRGGKFGSSSTWDEGLGCGNPGTTEKTAADGCALWRVVRSVCWSTGGANGFTCLVGGLCILDSECSSVTVASLSRFCCEKFILRIGAGWICV